jgi:hypothetical protein
MMDRKIWIFIGLSVLIILVGLSLTLNQNWKQFSGMDTSLKPLMDTLSNAVVFNERETVSLRQLVADSARVMFRFPPNTCTCLEPDFSEAVNQVTSSTGESTVFVVIAAADSKDIFYFRERTELSCPVYGTTDTLLTSFDAGHAPYACVVFPDMTAQNIVAVYPSTIKELISHARKAIR